MAGLSSGRLAAKNCDSTAGVRWRLAVAVMRSSLPPCRRVSLALTARSMRATMACRPSRTLYGLGGAVMCWLMRESGCCDVC